MKISLRDEVRMLPVRAVGPVMGRLVLPLVFTAALAAPKAARVTVAEDCVFVVMAAARKSVLDFVEFAHLRTIFSSRQITERASLRVNALPSAGVGAFVNASDRALVTTVGRLLRSEATVRRITAFLGTAANLTTDAVEAGILVDFVLTLEFMSKAIFDLGIEEVDATPDAMKFLAVEPVRHAIT